MSNIDGLLWLLLALGPLLFVQRRLHRETQAVLLLITRHHEISLALFSLLFFPGVLLHELSHFLTARVLGVRTGRFSLLPTPLADGRLRLGFVETASVDFFRDAFIGAAPLLSGGLFVAYAGIQRLKLTLLWESLAYGSLSIKDALTTIPVQADFWLWFYLAFTVSSMMLPSASDRRAWLPLMLVVVGLAGMALLGGAGPWMVVHLAPTLNQAMQALAVAFGISVFLHLALLLPMWGVRKMLSHFTGLEVA
jgi:hypothetical protein